MKYLIIIFFVFISCSKENHESNDLIFKINQFIPDELSVVSFSESNIKNFYEVELSDGTFFILMIRESIYFWGIYLKSKTAI